MVLAYHVIITNYGFWLPNDPRGSWSETVRSWELYLAGGPATKVQTRRSVAAVKHDYRRRQQAKEALVREPVVFTGRQAQAVGIGFSEFVQRSRVVIFACSIMPTHTHLVLGRAGYCAERAVNLLKGAASGKLARQGLHPFADSPYANGRLPSPWARRQWIVYLDDDADVFRAIEYTEHNPEKEGLPGQRWTFVVPYGAVPLRGDR